MEFKEFLLNENKAYLGQKVGDILSAVQDLQSDGANMGSRQVTKFSEKVVALIRRVLHGNWSENEEKHLKQLQKVGVALMKAVDEKDDIKEVLPSITQELQKISGDLGVPVNVLGEPDAQLPEQPPEGEPGQPPEQQPGMPPGQEAGGLPPMELPGAGGPEMGGGMPPQAPGMAPPPPPAGGMPM
jgi:hypothetical protein